MRPARNQCGSEVRPVFTVGFSVANTTVTMARARSASCDAIQHRSQNYAFSRYKNRRGPHKVRASFNEKSDELMVLMHFDQAAALSNPS
jgi:hypothetical protein